MKELLSLLSQSEDIKAFIKQLIPEIKEVATDVKPLVQDLIIFAVDQQAAAVKRYQEVHGFTREEAILLAINDKKNFLKSLNNQRSGK